MKKNILLSIFIIISFAAQSQRLQPLQTPEPVDPHRDKVEYKGHTIRIMPVAGDGYGYHVVKNKQLVIHQSYNPFTMSPNGLSKKEDVYKVAKWQIDHLEDELRGLGPTAQTAAPKGEPDLNSRGLEKNRGFGQRGPFVNQVLSKSLAKDLKIETDHPVHR